MSGITAGWKRLDHSPRRHILPLGSHLGIPHRPEHLLYFMLTMNKNKWGESHDFTLNGQLNIKKCTYKISCQITHQKMSRMTKCRSRWSLLTRREMHLKIMKTELWALSKIISFFCSFSTPYKMDHALAAAMFLWQSRLKLDTQTLWWCKSCGISGWKSLGIW